MPYVRRDAQGALLSLHRQAEGGATEWLADNDGLVLAFLAQQQAQGFQQLDADFIRVLEDLIDVLVDKHVINMTDLPAAARDKLAARRDHRRPTPLAELNLLGDAPDDDNAALRVYSQFP
ncbi:MAG: hypothetical protein V4795_24785 [Pseudomonadota bacterium]